MSLSLSRTLCVIAALLAASCTATPASTPAPEQLQAAMPAPVTPAGDWHGRMVLRPGVELRLGLHVDETSPGVFTGMMVSPDQGPGARPQAVTFENGELTVKAAQTYVGKWDAEQKAWVGTFTGPMGTLPVMFTAGPVPPLPPNPPVAGLDGRWEGTVMGLKLVLRVKTDTTGTIVMMDSPMQNVGNLPVPVFTRDADTVAFSMPLIGATYSGKLAPAGDKITGIFTQGGPAPLELTHVSNDMTPAVSINRPQTPTKPYPYKEEQVVVDNPASPGLRLPCTLTIPEGAGPHPAAFLISGTGAQDRDENLVGHRPFLILADHLTRKGIAILRCDDRDLVRPITNGEMSSLVSEFVTDAKAAVALLRARPDIDPRRIGLIGHSEGGVTGPRLAAEDPGIAFVVTMAGVGVRGRDALLEQRVLLVQSTGASAEAVAATRIFFGTMFDAMLAAPDQAAAKATAIAAMKASDTAPPDADKPRMTDEQIETAAAQFASKYYLDLLAYDPAAYVPKVTAPFLAINGSKDVQVEPKQNLAGFRALLKDNKDATFIELPGLNHLFQTAPTGAVTEYGEIDETLAPAALDAISDWIVKRMKP